jgi:hypothetical protein
MRRRSAAVAGRKTMLKKLGFATALLLMVSVSFPLSAKSSWDYTGRITARAVNSITVFDREHVKLTIDERTTITSWIREKPYVRKAAYLNPSALKFAGLVRVRTRLGNRVADVIEVANDVQTTFSGPVVAFDETSVSVYDKEMDVVALRIGPNTPFTELFMVKPWVRKAVHLTPSDLKLGAHVQMYSSKADPLTAGRVDIAVAEPLRMPARTAANIDN